MSRRVVLMEIDSELYAAVGELVLLFGHIEWLIANIIFLSQISSKDHAIIQSSVAGQKYFEILLSFLFSKKLEELKNLGYNTNDLTEISRYRNTLTHGILFNQEGEVTIVDSAKPRSEHKEFSLPIVKEKIETLKIEGGRLLDFMESKGYAYHSPNQKGG